MSINFRNLNADEIDVRAAQVGESFGKGWAQLLLYKNARVDMQVLDEAVGAENWQREHYECKGNLFCRVSINVNYEACNVDFTANERWTSKSDAGSESNTEKEKGEASDSFKRACTNWGIGRELYTSPQIFINIDVTKNEKGKYNIKKGIRLFVSKFVVENKKITELEISASEKNINKVVFSWKDKKNNVESKQIAKQELKEAPEKNKLKELEKVNEYGTYDVKIRYADVVKNQYGKDVLKIQYLTNDDKILNQSQLLTTSFGTHLACNLLRSFGANNVDDIKFGDYEKIKESVKTINKNITKSIKYFKNKNGYDEFSIL